MEEMQIFDFVHRVSQNEELRKELANDPDGAIMREGFAPNVERVVKRLVPHASLSQPEKLTLCNPANWWLC